MSLVHNKSDNASGVKPKERSALQERLYTRHQTALSTFKESITSMNETIDRSQLILVKQLKENLSSSHACSTGTLEGEEGKISLHEEALDAYTLKLHDVHCGDVLPAFEDEFHKSSDCTFDDIKARMCAERLRVLQCAVALRDGYQHRMDTIAACAEALRREERARKDAIQSALRDFMSSLAKISYCSVESSHVLAQRVLHSVNEQIAMNFVATQTLLSQLSQREVLKQENYSATMATLYARCIKRMARSSTLWLRTLFQSSVFRRPAGRMACVEDVTVVSASSRRDAAHLLDNLGIVVSSLRSTAVTSGPEEDQQACGGTLSTGWLRLYCPDTGSDPFPQGSAQVVDEWRMKANVLLRNSLSSCTDVIAKVKALEKAHMTEARRLHAELKDTILWLYTLDAEEQQHLQRASLCDSEVSEVYAPFAHPDVEAVHELTISGDELAEPLLEALRVEGEWFESTVETGLLKSHAAYEQSVLQAYQSVLRWFERSTDELVGTARGVLNFLRQFYRRRYEASMDYKDDLQRLENKFMELSNRLENSALAEAAEELFAEGLECLELISKRYTTNHRETMSAITAAVDDVRSNTHTVCNQLQQKIGLESVAVTETRLIAERQQRMDAALAQMMADQSSHKKRGKRSEELSSQPQLTLSAIEDLPIEEVDYPQVTDLQGTVYNVVAPITIIPDETVHPKHPPPPEPVAPSQRPGKGVRPASRNHKSRTPDVTPPVPPQDVKPTAATQFVEHYQPCFEDSILAPESFITTRSIEEWKEHLRLEILNWLVALQSTTQTNIEAYCNRIRDESEKGINELLRRHRRRPASFQADVYECRVRTLENKVSASIKYGARLRDRAARVVALWTAFTSDAAALRSDIEVLEQLGALHDQAGKALSLSALQAQERKHTTLCKSYEESYEQRSANTIESLEKLKETLAAECTQYLADRAAALEQEETGDGVSLDEALARDPHYSLVSSILTQLNENVAAICKEAEEQREARKKTVTDAKTDYSVVYKQNMAEMQLHARINEVTMRLKAQVQSFILASRTDEEHIGEPIRQLEAALSETLVKPNVDTAIRALLRHEDSVVSPRDEAASSPSQNVQELAAETVSTLITQLSGQLLQARVAAQRQVSESTAAEIMAILDQLREGMYARGVQLSALVCAVELVVVAPSHYIEPKPLTAQNREESTRQGSRGSSGGRRGGRSKTAANAPQTLPLPAVTPVTTQFKAWAAAIKSDVTEIVRAHFDVYPPPLLRAIPGSTNSDDGTMEGVLATVEAACQAQETRLNNHLREALKVYYEQVQRVHAAVQAIPQFIATSIYALSAKTIESRLRKVLDVYNHFTSHNTTLRNAHRAAVKVILGSKSQQEVLKQLDGVEGSRQEISEEVLYRFWGMALREVQDEAGLHAARSYTATTSLFQLLKGLVTPEHLKPCDWEVPAGHHRGLRHLLHLKEKKDRANAHDGTQTGKRDKRSTQGEPSLLRSDGGRGGKDRGGAPADSLPAPVFTEADYPGLPLTRVRPLEGFNSEHPQFVVQALPSASTFFIVNDERPISESSAGRRGTSTSSRNRQVSTTESTQAEDGTTMSPPFSCPSSKVHQETVTLTRQSVDALNHVADSVAVSTSDSFQAWKEREEQWKRNWTLIVSRLRNPPPPGTVEAASAPPMATNH